LPPHELTKTFNCGVGMVVVVAAAQAAEVQGLLAAHGEAARVIGRLVPRATGNAPQVVLLGELQ
jgi:phosphoribosylformylglycinamidine cyclo-ligase